MQALFRHTGRTRCLNPKGVQAIHLFVIQCDWADVSGKTESPVRRPEDVPFPDVRNLPRTTPPTTTATSTSSGRTASATAAAWASWRKGSEGALRLRKK